MAITHLSGTVVGMSEGKPKATLILGAGWSYAAGLPLTKDLFKANPVVASLASKNRLKQVAGAYDRWATEHTPANGELFLQDVHQDGTLPWAWFVEYLARVLANPVEAETLANRNVRYSQRLTNRTYCHTHSSFISQALSMSYPMKQAARRAGVDIESVVRYAGVGLVDVGGTGEFSDEDIPRIQVFRDE